MKESEDSSKYAVQIDPDLKEFVPEYLENRKRDLDALRKNLEGWDFSGLKHIAHNMRGSGSVYGFTRISEIGKSLEKSAEEKDEGECVKCVRELSEFLQKVEIVYRRSHERT